MLKQEVFEKASMVFGVSVGIAHNITYTSVSEKRETKTETPETLKKLDDEVEINFIIAKAIESGRYRDLQDKLWKMNKKRHGRTKEVTIYKNAWKEIRNDR
jgi:hypothetical protein